jgi:tetratricopeptide (TPR) repeat protein
MQVIDLKCPGCGSPSSTAQRTCDHCGRQLVITSFSTLHTITPGEVQEYLSTYSGALEGNEKDPAINNAVGMCSLKLGLYQRARTHFEIAADQDINNSETYFYLAVALLEGKKPYTQPLDTIRKCTDYCTAATSLEPRGVYYLMLAWVTADFYERKYLKPLVPSATYLDQARAAMLTPTDIDTLQDVTRQPLSSIAL